MEQGQMPPQGGAPQEGAAPEGGDVMKELAASMMQDAEKYGQMASAVPPEIGEQLGMIAQTIAKTVEMLGVEVGPSKQGGVAENPDTAGTNAQPVDPRMA